MLRKTTFDLLIATLPELEQIVDSLDLENEDLNSALSEFEINLTELESDVGLTTFNTKNNPLEFFPDE